MATCPAGNVFSQHVHLINLTRSLVAARFLAIEVVAFGEVEGHNEAGHVHYLSLQPALDEILNLGVLLLEDEQLKDSRLDQGVVVAAPPRARPGPTPSLVPLNG